MRQRIYHESRSFDLEKIVNCGDLHIHTRYSDGSCDYKDTLLLARKRGLSAAFPASRFITEEQANGEGWTDDDMPAGMVWILDPIDGTTNFADTGRGYAVSLALYKDGRPELALVLDCDRGRLYSAVAGKGAKVDARRPRASARGRPRGDKPELDRIPRHPGRRLRLPEPGDPRAPRQALLHGRVLGTGRVKSDPVALLRGIPGKHPETHLTLTGVIHVPCMFCWTKRPGERPPGGPQQFKVFWSSASGPKIVRNGWL